MSQSARSATLPRPAVQKTAPRTVSPDAVGLALGWLLPALVTVWGASYYFASAGDRVRHPLHAFLKPSGTLGQAFGFIGLGLFLFMWLYPLRKAFGPRVQLGSVATWMRIHTVVGLSLPFLIAVHAGWRFRGLIGLGYLAMLTVSASGIVGRYLYGRIPRSRAGLELSRDEIAARRRSLITEIAVALRLDPHEVETSLLPAGAGAGVRGAGRTVRRLVSDDFARWRTVGELRRRWKDRARAVGADPRAVQRAVKLAKEEIRLGQQLRVLDATQSVFRYWHVAHRPVSITALIAVAIHVGVAIAMGQTWIR